MEKTLQEIRERVLAEMAEAEASSKLEQHPRRRAGQKGRADRHSARHGQAARRGAARKWASWSTRSAQAHGRGAGARAAES